MSNYADLIERLESYRPTNEWGDPVHHAIIDEAAACIREMVEWRPIETAPRDGAWIQAWRTPASPNDGWWEPLVHVRWDDEDEAWVWPDDTYEVFTESGCERADFKIADCEFYSDTSFTHWRPLPLPPAPGAEDE